jgi:hypothetical protein
MMDVKKAAHVILKGVTRNKAVITFPFYAGLLWWLYRFNPSFLNPFIRKTVMDFRAIRKKNSVLD